MRFEQKNASEKRIIFPIPTQKILLGPAVSSSKIPRNATKIEENHWTLDFVWKSIPQNSWFLQT